MELTSDFPFWSIRDGLPQSYPSLQRDITCDAVVVGGGITGAMAAFHLAKDGVDTVLLDKRDVGTGSTCGSTGLLQYEIDLPLRELARRVGGDRAARAYRLNYEAIRKIGDLARACKIDCDFARRPSLYLAREQGETPGFVEECKLRQQLDFEVECWSQRDIAAHFPFCRPCALFSENAAQVDPYRLTHGLLGAASQHGLRVYDRTAAARFSAERRGIRVKTEAGFVVKARRAVLAAGYESIRYVRGEAGRLKSTYALISEPASDDATWFRQSLIWESGMPYLYMRGAENGRVIVGGEDVNLVKAGRRDALICRKTKTLLRKFAELFPQRQLEVAYAWAGTFGETKDGLPYIGENPGLRHAYFALGYGGNGITYSLIAAEIIRDLFLGRRNADAEVFKFGR